MQIDLDVNVSYSYLNWPGDHEMFPKTFHGVKAELTTSPEAFDALQTIPAVNYRGNATERHARKAAQSFMIRSTSHQG